jgi:hypothetical protein
MEAGRSLGHINNPEAHREIGVVQGAKIKPTGLERVISSHRLSADPPAEHRHQNKMRRHGAARPVIEGIDCREQALST